MMDNIETLDHVKEIYDDKCATIGSNDYHFTTMTHKQRRKIFAFFTRINNGDMSFLDWPDFDAIEKLICDRVTFNGMQISKLPGHWEQYPEDYILFITTAMAVISYPFLKGVNGN